MNQVQFQVKRAHWRLWDFEAKLLAPLGTTPARLDMLQCIAQLGAPTQTLLRVRLGLSPSTVSKMLRLLEERGFVARNWNPDDLRERLARLTDRARDLLAKVERILLKSGIGALAQVRCLVDLPSTPTKVTSLFERTKRVQWALEDRAGFVPLTVPLAEADRGRELDDKEKKLYRAAIDYCRARFSHLPVAYLLGL